MYGLYINDNPLIAPFIGVYPTVKLVVATIKNITNQEISSSEISAAILLVDSFYYEKNGIEIVVTTIARDMIDMCSRYDGSTIRVKNDLLNRS